MSGRLVSGGLEQNKLTPFKRLRGYRGSFAPLRGRAREVPDPSRSKSDVG